MSEKKSAYTLRTLLEELSERIPEFSSGQIFETLKSIYPDKEIPRNKRNIMYKGKIFTKPLALSRKDKNILVKEESAITYFFRNLDRGDFIKIVESDGVIAKCENLSLKEEIKERFYNDEKSDFITIRLEDVANGTVKPYRKKVDKFLTG